MADIRLYFHILSLYWEVLFIVIYPLVLGLIFLIDTTPGYRCIYCILLIIGIWSVGALTAGAVSLLPMLLFPLFFISSSSTTCKAYYSDTLFQYMSMIISSLALDKSKCTLKISMYILYWTGCESRKINIFIMCGTSIFSLLFRPLIVIFQFAPIVHRMLLKMDELKIQAYYAEEMSEHIKTDLLQLDAEHRTSQIFDLEEEEKNQDEIIKLLETRASLKLSKHTTFQFLTILYSSIITKSYVSPINYETIKSITLSRFTKAPPFYFVTWLFVNFTLMFIILIIAWILLQSIYKKTYKFKKKAEHDKINERATQELLKQINKMKKHPSFQEISTIIIHVLMLIMWKLHDKYIFKDIVARYNIEVSKTSVGMIFVLLYFVIPSAPYNYITFWTNYDHLSALAFQPLLTWRTLSRSFPWFLMMTLGSRLAHSAAVRETELNSIIGNLIKSWHPYKKFTTLIYSCSLAALLTEILNSNLVVKIILQGILEMSIAGKQHPLYVTIPAVLAAQQGLILPCSTAAAIILNSHWYVSIKDIMLIGSVMKIINFIYFIIMYSTIVPYVFNSHEFPEWAKNTT